MGNGSLVDNLKWVSRIDAMYETPSKLETLLDLYRSGSYKQQATCLVAEQVEVAGPELKFHTVPVAALPLNQLEQL